MLICQLLLSILLLVSGFLQFSLSEWFGLQATSLNNSVNDYILALDLRSEVAPKQAVMLEGDGCKMCEGQPRYHPSKTAQVVSRDKELRSYRGLCDGDEIEDSLGSTGAQSFQLTFTRATDLHDFHDLGALTGFVVLLP